MPQLWPVAKPPGMRALRCCSRIRGAVPRIGAVRGRPERIVNVPALGLPECCSNLRVDPVQQDHEPVTIAAVGGPGRPRRGLWAVAAVLDGLRAPWLTGGAGGGLRGLGLAGLAALAACAPVGPDDAGGSPAGRGVPAGEFTVVPPAAAWMSAPQALLVLQASDRFSASQRLLLPNATPEPGDNALYLRVFRHSGDVTPAFRQEDLRRAAGGIPTPFVRFDDSGLRVREDAAGSLLWLEDMRRGVHMCVLAVRRLGVEDRVIPASGDVLDVVLRNCVTSGDAEEALRPIAADAVLYPALRRARGGLTASPLAVPAH